MKLLRTSVLVLLAALPAAARQGEDPAANELCCVPASLVPPPPTLGCSSSQHCGGTPDCSGRTAAYLAGLACIPGEGHCDQEPSILIVMDVPVYECQVRWLGNNLCVQMYPKWTCVWVMTQDTASAGYVGNFCGQAGDDWCM